MADELVARRDLLRAGAATAGLGVASEDALDEAWAFLHKREPQAKQGLATHAPMVAEALTALGHGDRAIPWIEGYRAPLRELPRRSAPIDPSSWRTALGPDRAAPDWESANHRWADWAEFFAAELEESAWRDVLDVWVGRLAPGLSGGATHGVIRTAHAVRALGRRDSKVRRAELARALAYWASCFEELPASEGAPHPAPNFTAALAEVPLYWDAFQRAPDGRNIVEQLRHAASLENFGRVRALTPEAKELPAAISALTGTFARVYLRHGSKHHTIGFVHAVTGPCALRRILPFVKPATAHTAFAYSWQVAAAIYAAYARRDDAQPPAEETNRAPDDLVAAAIRNGDEHAIKFTEVMVAEHAIQPDPIYLAAAGNAISRLG